MKRAHPAAMLARSLLAGCGRRAVRAVAARDQAGQIADAGLAAVRASAPSCSPSSSPRHGSRSADRRGMRAAARARAHRHRARARLSRRSTLTLLLGYGVWLMRAQLDARREPTRIRIEVTGEQWWWRVAYRRRRRPIASANEIRIPVGRPVEFTLQGRRRDPQLLGAEPRRQGRHDPRPHHALAAHGRAAGHLSRPVRRILRRAACADGVRGRRHAAGRVRRMARARGRAGARARERQRAARARRCSSRPAAAPATRCAAPRPPARSART